MKAKPAKKSGKVVVQFNPRTEPHIAAAFTDAWQDNSPVKIKRILATTDFSDLSLEAVEYAVALADEFGSSLSLIHVVPAVTFSGLESVVLARSEEEVFKAETRHLAKLAKQFGSKKPIKPISRHGKPYREITEAAKELRSDLIVTSTKGHTGLKRAFIGSTAEWVTRHAPCPVLTVPAATANRLSGKRWARRIKKIMVPVDFSETSTRALPYAAALAEKFRAEVLLIHVIEPIPAYGGFDYLPSTVIENQASEQAAEELLLRAQREAFPEKICTEVLVRSGSPFHEITRTATRENVDLIVLTTHGLTGLKHVLMGSTAERIVRHAECPVLVVRNQESA